MRCSGFEGTDVRCSNCGESIMAHGADAEQLLARMIASTIPARLCNCEHCVSLSMGAEPDPDDSAALLAAAEQAIRRTLADGQGKYQPGEWKGKDVYEHLEHADDHCGHLRWRLYPPADEVEAQRMHLRHLLTRAAMALALLQLVVGTTQSLPDGHALTTFSNGATLTTMPDRTGGQASAVSQPQGQPQPLVVVPQLPLPAEPVRGRQ